MDFQNVAFGPRCDSRPTVVYAGSNGLCMDFPSGRHTFTYMTAFYVLCVEGLSKNENLMAYGYEMEFRTRTLGRDSMLAFGQDLTDFGFTPETFLLGVRQIVRDHFGGLITLPFGPFMRSMLPLSEYSALAYAP